MSVTTSPHALRTPLQQPYDGPYKVLKHPQKHFTVDIKGHSEVVSLDRLKAAHLDILVETPCHPRSTSSTVPVPPTTTSPDTSPTPDTSSTPPVAPSTTPAEVRVARSGCRVH